MAAVVKCDGCGNCVSHKEATHVRTYKMDSATSYRTSDVKHTAELCSVCYARLCEMIGKEAKRNA